MIHNTIVLGVSNNSTKSTPKSNFFRQTSTFRAVDFKTSCTSALPLRQDIDMHAQLESIAEQRRNGCSTADWRVYVTTWATQETHEKFLLCLLGESRRYCRRYGLYAERRKSIRSLLGRVNQDMTDTETDRYMTLASEIAGYGLFHQPSKAATPPASPSYRRREHIAFPTASAKCTATAPEMAMVSIPTPDPSDALGAQRLDVGVLQTA